MTLLFYKVMELSPDALQGKSVEPFIAHKVQGFGQEKNLFSVVGILVASTFAVLDDCGWKELVRTRNKF